MSRRAGLAPTLVALGCVVVALVALPRAADASGISTPRLSAGWASPTFATPASIRFNPAILASLQGVQLDASVAVLYGRATYRRERRAAYQRADGLDFSLPVAPADMDPLRSGWQPEVVGTVTLPAGAAALSWRVTDRVALGLSVYPRVGAVLKFPDAGPHQWQMQEVALLATSITPAIAFRATPWLHFGVGVDVVSGLMSLRQVTDLATTPMLRDALGQPPISQANDMGPNAPPAVRELDVLGRQVTIRNAQALGWSVKLGATADLSEAVRLGLSYQHVTDLVFTGDAWLDMNHDLFTQDLASQGLQYPALVKGRAFVALPLPAVARVGLGVTLSDSLALHGQVAWVRYSAVRSLDVTLQSPDFVQPQLGLGDTTAISLERAWLDTVEAEALLAWRPSASARIGLRAGYHSPMSPDATVDLVSIDGHRLVAMVMARKAWGGFALTGAVGVHHVLPRVVVASRYDRGNGVYGLTIVHGNLGLAWRW